jgi:hypothetical protein
MLPKDCYSNNIKSCQPEEIVSCIVE